MRSTFALFVGASLVLASAATAQDLTRRAIPQKWVEPLLPEDLPKLELPDYVSKDALETARAQAFSGRYKIALMSLTKVKAGDATEIALVRAAALAPLGRREEAISALSTPPVKDDPRVQIARARILSELGRDADAIALLRDHLQKNKDSIAGHYWLGHIAEKTGDLATARDAYAFFEPFIDKWQGDRTQFNNAEDVTTIGRGLDRWATLTSAYQTRDALHNTVLAMFLKAYDEIDRGYWPAHVAAAEYYVSHDDEQSAMKELQKAADGNPQDIHSLAVLGRITVESFNFDATDSAITSIRDVDPDSIDGDLLLVRNLLKQRRPTDAQAAVKRILEKQPHNIEALGLLAATEALQLHDDKTTAILKQVEQLDPQNATAYAEVAEQLSAMRQYPRAAAMYKVAVDRAPGGPPPATAWVSSTPRAVTKKTPWQCSTPPTRSIPSITPRRTISACSMTS